MNIKNNKGFSLLEVMIAVGVMAVIGGVGTPIYRGYMATAKRTASQSTLGQIFKVTSLVLTEIDAPANATTNFATSINEKLKGDIVTDEAYYLNANTWCADIEPVGDSPKGCVDSNGKVYLDKSSVKAADIKKESICNLYAGSWASATCTLPANSKHDCKTTTAVCGS